MKKVHLWLAVLPLLFLGSAAPDHVAIGPLHFGATYSNAIRVCRDWRDRLYKKRFMTGWFFTAGDVRQSLLYEGTKTPGKLTAQDRDFKVWIDPHRDRPRLAAVDIWAMDPGTPAEWDTKCKDLWHQFRDICDSKFERSPRGGPAGLWPEIEKIEGKDFIVTDTWEYDEIKVELGFLPFEANIAQQRGFAPARVVLRVTNPLTQ